MAVRYNTYIPTDGLIFHVDAKNPKSYPGSGSTWYDLSKLKNNMEFVNGPVYSSSGHFTFDGSNDYAITHVSDFEPAFDVANFTTIVWFRPLSLPGSDRYIFSHGESFDTDKIKFGLHTTASGVFRSWFEAQDDADYFAGTAPLSTNNWYQGATTYDANTNAWRIYLNGVVTDTATPAQDPASIDHALTLGCRTNGGYLYQNFFNGDISVAKYYNKVLSDAEILQSFNAFRGRYGI